MAKLIDKDAVMNVLRKISVIQSMDIVQEVAFAEGVDAAIAVVDVSPTVDAVEVVRCKDCEFGQKPTVCARLGTVVKPNDFCSRGVKKDAVD